MGNQYIIEAESLQAALQNAMFEAEQGRLCDGKDLRKLEVPAMLSYLRKVMYNKQSWCAREKPCRMQTVGP